MNTLVQRPKTLVSRNSSRSSRRIVGGAVALEPFPYRFERDGHRLAVRYLEPGDAERFQTFFRSLTPETVRCRYGHMIAEMTDESARQLVSVDPLTEPALAIVDADESAAIRAIGRYYFDPETQSAEVAIVVAESFRRHGLARLLLNTLTSLARSRGVKALHAYVMTTDAPVLLLLKSAGFVPEGRSADGDLKLTLQLK